MHYKWKIWQEDAGLESKLQRMRLEKKQKKLEIYYHQYYISKQELLIAEMKSKLYNAKQEYEQMDLDMALIDGRFSYITEEPKKYNKSIGKELKGLSKSEVERLIEELKAMG